MSAGANPLLAIDGVSMHFGAKSASFWAVHDVSLLIRKGECVAIVGESGSGKSTMARMVVGLMPPTKGQIRFAGEDVAALARSRSGRKRLATRLQMVFQDPHSSLDPLMPLERIIGEPLTIFGWSRDDIAARVAEVMRLVGLPAEFARRLPRELSGGQRQRVGIARALAPRPELLVLDEPVASLDVSIQGQVLRLLKDIQAATGIAVLIIAHDLGVVRAVADRTLVMYAGRLVETGPTEGVFDRPIHPYTAALLWSGAPERQAGVTEEMRAALAREPLAAEERRHGCVFRSRCWRAIERCSVEVDTVQADRDHLGYCNVPLPQPAFVAEAEA